MWIVTHQSSHRYTVAVNVAVTVQANERRRGGGGGVDSHLGEKSKENKLVPCNPKKITVKIILRTITRYCLTEVWKSFT